MPRIMNKLISKLFASIMLLGACVSVYAQAPDTSKPDTSMKSAEKEIEALDKAMYSPFVELYFLEELKKLRIDLSDQRHELLQQIVDREHRTLDRAVTYATDTITYFFYLIAAASSILVLVGWTSLRDIKDKVHSVANEEVNQLVKTYEARLKSIEEQLTLKTEQIDSNRNELELTQEIQSLWLRAGQDINHHNRITIYDDILKLKPDDCEALTYKADTVLEIGEPQWAANLCQQALKIDKENSHAFYQLACAYTQLELYQEAFDNLERAISQHESYKNEAINDSALKKLHKFDQFKDLVSLNA